MKYQRRVLGLLAALSVITYIDRVCIAVAGPPMQDDLHIGPEAWGWVASIFFLSYSAFEIPTGILGDRIGPRRVLTRIVLWVVGFHDADGSRLGLPAAAARAFLLRHGRGGGLPERLGGDRALDSGAPQRTRVGIVWMTSQIGAAISPLLVVPIQMHYGWRASFLVFGSSA